MLLDIDADRLYVRARRDCRAGSGIEPQTNWYFVGVLVRAEIMGTRHQAGLQRPGRIRVRESQYSPVLNALARAGACEPEWLHREDFCVLPR